MDLLTASGKIIRARYVISTFLARRQNLSNFLILQSFIYKDSTTRQLITYRASRIPLYVDFMRKKGKTDKEIAQLFIKAGWGKEDIEYILRRI